jgi:hypothetical protein
LDMNMEFRTELGMALDMELHMELHKQVKFSRNKPLLLQELDRQMSHCCKKCCC